MSLSIERPTRATVVPRPRFQAHLETIPLTLPSGTALGPVISAIRAANGDLYVLHQWDWENNAIGGEVGNRLPPLARFNAAGAFLDAWGGHDYLPRIAGASQWPSGLDGLDVDDEGNLWIFGWAAGDTALLKLSPNGELLLRIGEPGRAGGDDDTTLLDRPTSCYHDIAAREVFVSDGYGNHRVIAFNSDTGEFTRMWGAFGKKPSSLSPEEAFGNPVHKVARGPDGRIYVCDRIKCRVQEFELVEGGARFLREVMVAPGTGGYGTTFDLAFSPDGQFMHVADGTNNRIWTVGLDNFAVLGWISTEAEGEDNCPKDGGLIHRFSIEPSGDLLLACTDGVKRMKYLGVV